MTDTTTRGNGGRADGVHRRGWAALSLLAASILLSAPTEAVAQRRGEGPPGPDREEIQRRIQARFGQIVREQLGLDAEEQRALAEVIRDAEGRRRELRRREMALRRHLRDQATLLPRSAPAPLLSDERAREVLGEMRAIREEERRLFDVEQERLLEILGPAQLVRFYALREELAHRVRRLQQRPGGVGPPGGPPGPFPRGR